MRETWTCGRCGLTDATVLNLDTGNAYHPEWRNCVAAVQQQLAAARAEVETLKRHAVLREIDCANEMARANAAEEERDRMAEEVGQLTADLAAVRKVEEWEGLRGTRIKWVEAPREQQSEWRAWSWGLRATANPRIVATGDSIIALGRALAAQEGTDAT